MVPIQKSRIKTTINSTDSIASLKKRKISGQGALFKLGIDVAAATGLAGKCARLVCALGGRGAVSEWVWGGVGERAFCVRGCGG